MAKKKPDVPLFDDYRTDPKKASDGVWITHPDTGDRFLVRRAMCPEYVRAYLEAAEDLGDEAQTDEGKRRTEAVALATGVVLDWKLHGRDIPYDSTKMASALADPELQDLRTFIRMGAAERQNFRPDRAAGN